MRTRIKICGIQSPELALQTAKAGADYIGLVCVPTSKRFVSRKQIPDLVSAIHQGGAQAVLVVQDSKTADLMPLLATAPFDLIQLHGQCAVTLPHNLPRIYAINAQTKHFPQIDQIRDFLIIDHQHPGSGQTFCWQNFAPPQSTRWFLAGGLTAENVSQGIKKFSPFAVDVSSGVEDSSGSKQLENIRTFIHAATQKTKEK